MLFELVALFITVLVCVFLFLLSFPFPSNSLESNLGFSTSLYAVYCQQLSLLTVLQLQICKLFKSGSHVEA